LRTQACLPMEKAVEWNLIALGEAGRTDGGTKGKVGLGVEQ
jgi:hypothetical protein